jgi:hypothetical protein
MDFPGHEKAIDILSKAEDELSALGYKVNFVKSCSQEECLPAYSNTHFALKFTASKWEHETKTHPGLTETETREFRGNTATTRA